MQIHLGLRRKKKKKWKYMMSQPQTNDQFHIDRQIHDKGKTNLQIMLNPNSMFSSVLLIFVLFPFLFFFPPLICGIFLELDYFRNVNRIPVDAVSPGTIRWSFDRFVAFPNRTVAFKPTPECNLPNSISLFHPPFSFNVSQFVPE